MKQDPVAHCGLCGDPVMFVTNYDGELATWCSSCATDRMVAVKRPKNFLRYSSSYT